MLLSLPRRLLLVALAIGALPAVVWTLRTTEPSYAGLQIGTTLPRVQAQLEQTGGELRCQAVPWTHLTECKWWGILPGLAATPVEIQILADQRHRMVGEIRIEHALPPGTSAEEWMGPVLREWDATGAIPERERSALTLTVQRPRAQSGYRGARANVEESTRRVVVVLFDTTIVAHAAEPGPE
jgi:hypothetical protein